jgi:hypothetical protein
LDGKNVLSQLSKVDAETQTDGLLPTSTYSPAEEQPAGKSDLEKSFDEYINKCCTLGEDHEVSSVNIMGQYRIWSQTAGKESFHALNDYLHKRFRPIRMSSQDQTNVVHGYRGVQLNSVKIPYPAIPTDVERFLFQECEFHPSGKVLQATVLQKYLEWAENLNIAADPKDLKKHLAENANVLVSCLWAPEGNGQGYYGLRLKQQIRRPVDGGNGKAVEKRDKEHNTVKQWPTIAKAALDENMPACKLSRMIKGRKETDEGCYYIVVPRA